MIRPLALSLATVFLLAGCGLGQVSGLARVFGGGQAQAAARSTGAAGADDAVKRAILAGPTAPKTIFEVRERLLARGGKLATHIVANRGHDNPEAGSFSFFEAYSGPMEGGQVQEGELYIGFFSEREGPTLQVQQGFEPGLMIELIAWDYTKKQFNFWELIGTGQSSAWHFRGDSSDVLADVAQVAPGQSKANFGAKLRCSGCHTLGGPIMKEVEGPNNDWWSDEEKLALGSMKLASTTAPNLKARTAAQLFKGARDASNLARLVKAGTDRMLAERARRGGDGQTLNQELRSLFGVMEINLASDVKPFKANAAVQLPVGFFVDERLAGKANGPTVGAAAYRAALAQAGSAFAADEQPGLAETHHAFVVPTRSYVDQQQLDALVSRGLLDEELIADVLAVDLTTPVFSTARASLLRHVPARAANAADLKAQLVAALSKDPAAAAKELLANLTDPARTAAAHRKRAQAVLAAAGKAGDITGWLRLASQRRAELAAAPTGQNPRGTILEPGFRVIFPTDKLQPKPFALRLREDATVEAVR